jgi:hypothetical protein
MVTMIPCDIGKFGAEGEKAFHKFLQGVAKRAIGVRSTLFTLIKTRER